MQDNHRGADRSGFDGLVGAGRLLAIASGDPVDAASPARGLPRHDGGATDLPADDFWMLDDDRVMFTVFEPSGRFAGGALTRDDQIVAYCRSVRDRLWAAAVPHKAYVSGSQPV